MGKHRAVTDPGHSPDSKGSGPMATWVDEPALDERLARLEAARAWSPRVVSRLEALIRSGDDAALFRINPFTFAAERGLGEQEAIDLFLHASASGLFETDWLLICPRCDNKIILSSSFRHCAIRSKKQYQVHHVQQYFLIHSHEAQP
jgi:hypothetical protein